MEGCMCWRTPEPELLAPDIVEAIVEGADDPAPGFPPSSLSSSQLCSRWRARSSYAVTSRSVSCAPTLVRIPVEQLPQVGTLFLGFLQKVPNGFLLLRHGSGNANRPGLHINDDVVWMGNRIGMFDPQFFATTKLTLPFDLVVDRGLQPLVVKVLVVPFDRGKKLCEQTLCPLVALGGTDGKRPDHGLRHRDSDRAACIVDVNGAVRLVEDNGLEALLIK